VDDLSSLEARIAVLEAVLPRVETKLDEHRMETRRAACLAVNSRKEISDALVSLKEVVDAQMNQAKGVGLVWEFVRTTVIFFGSLTLFKWFGFLK
jgi:hypothetical protein